MKRNRIKTLTLGFAAACLTLGLGAGLPALSDAPEKTDGISDAWIDGRLEATYFFNRHLSSFDIETDVEHGVVVLTGIVTSDVERDLAGEIARGLKGVKEVRNRLEVARDGSKPARKKDNEFVRFVNDATITAAVKLELLKADSVPGMSIDVDTDQGVVTLNGKVDSGAAKSLAAKLTQNVDGVVRVENRLMVAGS